MTEHAVWIRALVEAEGYLELGMYDESSRVLEGLSEENKGRKEVLAFRVALHMTAEQWQIAAEIASCLVAMEPEESGWWVNLAYSVRRARSLEEAEIILDRAAKLHPDTAIIHYNLACYACITGRIELAKERLTQARSLDGAVREMANRDDDLRAIWDWVAEWR